MAATPLYMAWHDQTGKKSVETNIKEALERYREVHGEPTVIVVPKGSTVTKDFGIPVRDDDQNMVRVSHVYVGHDGDKK